jgi:dipeptidyl aminopeptidase/acylaminoacyl peptidase
MRNIFSSIVALVICSVSFAQTNIQPMTEQEVLTLLCHKWEYKEYLSDGQKLPYPRKWIDASLLFKSDGSIIKREDDKDVTGIWSYNHKRLLITIEFQKEKERWRIQNISEKEFMFREYNDPPGFSTVMLRVD